MSNFIEGKSDFDNRPTIHFKLPRGRAITREDGTRREGVITDKDVYMPVVEPVSLYSHIRSKVEGQGMRYVAHYNFPEPGAPVYDAIEKQRLRDFAALEQKLSQLPKHETERPSPKSSPTNGSGTANKSVVGARKKAGQTA